MRGRCRWAQDSGYAPSPGLLRNPTSPGCGRGERNKVHANSRTCSRGALMRPSFAHDHDAKNRFASGNQRGKRSAERRMPSMSASAQTSVRELAPLIRSAAAHPQLLPPPLAGEGQEGGHARLSALTLAALATGYHPDGSAPEPGFPKTDFASVLPAWPSCLRLSTLRADRSFCRPTGDPEPPGSGLAIPRAGTAPRFRLSGLPFRKGALHERGGVYNRNGDGCQGMVLGRATKRGANWPPRARSPAIVTKRRQQVARIERSEIRRGISGPKCRSRVSLRSTRATVVRELLGCRLLVHLRSPHPDLSRERE